MIKLTLREMAPMINSFNAILNLPLPARDAYRLGIAAKQIQERVVVYEQTRQNLIKKYGETVETPQKETFMSVKAENVESFTKELEPLLEETLEINMDPIPVDTVADSKLNAIDMLNLSPFFCESKDK